MKSPSLRIIGCLALLLPLGCASSGAPGSVAVATSSQGAVASGYRAGLRGPRRLRGLRGLRPYGIQGLRRPRRPRPYGSHGSAFVAGLPGAGAKGGQGSSGNFSASTLGGAISLGGNTYTYDRATGTIIMSSGVPQQTVPGTAQQEPLLPQVSFDPVTSTWYWH